MRRWSVLLVLSLSLLVFGLLYSQQAARRPSLDPVTDHASFRTNAWGTKALRELLVHSGLSARTWGKPWSSLSPDVKLLWIIDPERRPTREEISALLAWVARDGRAIIAPDPRKEPRAWSQDAGAADALLLSYIGWSAADRGNNGASDVKARGRDPLLRDVRSLHVSGWRLQPMPGGHPMPSSKASPHHPRATRPVQSLPGVALMTDHRGILMARLKHGRGEIILLCDADILGNRWIAQADNVILAANLAFGSPDGVAWFDEYHHGHAGSEAFAGLDARAPVWALWATVLCAALFFAGKLWRFGPPIPQAVPPRRSGLEYVAAFAGLYERSGHRRAVLDMIVSRFRRRISLMAAVRPDAPATTIATALARRYPHVDAAATASLLIRCEGLTGSASPRQITNDELLQITRAISYLEGALARHDNTIGQQRPRR